MRRSQIYLDERDAALLDQRAEAEGTTRSSLIRRAISLYLGSEEDAAASMRRFRAAVEAAAGTAHRLPPGEEYVETLRSIDARRQRELDQRWNR